MSVRAFKFFVVEGTKSFFKNGLMSVASVVTVSMCLILCGLYVIFSMNLNYAAKQVETNMKSSCSLKKELRIQGLRTSEN